MRTKKYSSHGPTNFLKNTYGILNNETLSSTIRWTEDGGSFLICDIYSFTNTVLPSFFKHSNLSSFIRQLNMYGFHKSKEDDSEIIQFSHPSFHRDKKELLKEIHRKSSESLGSLKKDDIVVLAERLQKFQSQQHTMETMLGNLEHQYFQVMEQNQTLISELYQSKQREKQIEFFFRNFTQKKKEEIRNCAEGSGNSLNLECEPHYPEVHASDEDWEKYEYY